MTHHPTPRERSGAHPDDFKPEPLTAIERFVYGVICLLGLIAVSSLAGYLWGRLV